MEIKRRVGRNVKFYRKKKGLSQEKLGFDCELHRTYISGIERGLRNPTVEILQRIADALSIPAFKLLIDDREQPPTQD